LLGSLLASQIRSAYRKLALKFHPDRNASAEAQERWEGVPAAYAVLSNPNDRMEYDATLVTRDALVEFYKAYNPAKLDNATIQTIIDGWYGREVELFRMLNAKYEIAPHQGTNKSLQRQAAAMPMDKARAIRRDSLAAKGKDAASAEISWAGTIGSAFCCKSALSRLASTTYYEVETQSPGFVTAHGHSDTPGQAMPSTVASPVTPTGLSKPMSPPDAPPLAADGDNTSTATTEDEGGSPASVVSEEDAGAPSGPAKPALATAC
jgi:hypothetical protein